MRRLVEKYRKFCYNINRIDFKEKQKEMGIITCDNAGCDYYRVSGCSKKMVMLNGGGQCMEFWAKNGQPRMVRDMIGRVIPNPQAADFDIIEVTDVKDITPVEEPETNPKEE